MNRRGEVRVAAKSGCRAQSHKGTKAYIVSFRSSSTLCHMAAQDNQEIDRALSTLKRTLTQD